MSKYYSYYVLELIGLWISVLQISALNTPESDITLKAEEEEVVTVNMPFSSNSNLITRKKRITADMEKK